MGESSPAAAARALATRTGAPVMVSLGAPLRWAIVGAALSTRRPGAQAGLPTAAEVVAHLGAALDPETRAGDG